MEKVKLLFYESQKNSQKSIFSIILFDIPKIEKNKKTKKISYKWDFTLIDSQSKNILSLAKSDVGKSIYTLTSKYIYFFTLFLLLILLTFYFSLNSFFLS